MYIKNISPIDVSDNDVDATENIANVSFGHVYLHWNLCVMDTLGTNLKCPDYQGYLVVKYHFGTTCGLYRCPYF